MPIQAILSLPPLHMNVKRKAEQNAFKLFYADRFKPGDLTSQLKILQKVSLKSTAKATDIIPVELYFSIPYEVVTQDCQI